MHTIQQLLAWSAVATAAVVPAVKRQDTGSPYLNAEMTAAGKLWFGSEIGTGTQETADSAYMTIFNNSQIFGGTTPGNSMKWSFTEPEQGTFTLSEGQATIDLAAATSKKVRCHNLVWSAELPGWLTGGSWTNETLMVVMENHITTLIKGYGTGCYSWDVVNEALNGDGSFTSNVFLTHIGKAYVPLAFQYANAAVQSIGGGVKLYYNDYGIENPGTKQEAAANLVKTIQGWSGAAIDGVGLESHFSTSYYPSASSQVSAMSSYTDLGVEVAVTELDVACSAVPCSSSDLATQATAYYDTVSACMQTHACIGVTVWDFDDDYSWIQPSSNSGSGDSDLYYADLTRHPAYQACSDAINGASCSVC